MRPGPIPEERTRRRQIAIAALVLLIALSARAEHTVYEENFSTGTVGWSGSPDFFWDNLNGHVTSGGAGRNLGSGKHTLESPCIRIDDQPVLASKYRRIFSIRANQNADAKTLIYPYRNPDCTDIPYIILAPFSLQDDIWSRLSGSTPETFLPPTIRSVRLVFEVESTGISFFSSYVDDVQLINEGPEEMLDNARFHDDLSSWFLHWGDSVAHDASEGDVTPSSAARVEGHVDSFAGISHECIALSQLPYPEGAFHVGAAVKATGAVGGAPGADIFVDYFTDTACTSRDGSQQILTNGTIGEWSRVEGNFTPQAGTQSIRVVVATFNAPDGAITYFDDVTLYSTTIFMDGFESGNVSAWSTSN